MNKRDAYRFRTRQYRKEAGQWSSLSLELCTWLQWRNANNIASQYRFHHGRKYYINKFIKEY